MRECKGNKTVNVIQNKIKDGKERLKKKKHAGKEKEKNKYHLKTSDNQHEILNLL